MTTLLRSPSDNFTDVASSPISSSQVILRHLSLLLKHLWASLSRLRSLLRLRNDSLAGDSSYIFYHSRLSAYFMVNLNLDNASCPTPLLASTSEDTYFE